MYTLMLHFRFLLLFRLLSSESYCVVHWMSHLVDHFDFNIPLGLRERGRQEIIDLNKIKTYVGKELFALKSPGLIHWEEKVTRIWKRERRWSLRNWNQLTVHQMPSPKITKLRSQ